MSLQLTSFSVKRLARKDRLPHYHRSDDSFYTSPCHLQKLEIHKTNYLLHTNLKKYCHPLLCDRQLLLPTIRDKWSIELVGARMIEKLHQPDELTNLRNIPRSFRLVIVNQTHYSPPLRKLTVNTSVPPQLWNPSRQWADTHHSSVPDTGRFAAFIFTVGIIRSLEWKGIWRE